MYDFIGKQHRKKSIASSILIKNQNILNDTKTQIILFPDEYVFKNITVYYILIGEWGRILHIFAIFSDH